LLDNQAHAERLELKALQEIQVKMELQANLVLLGRLERMEILAKTVPAEHLELQAMMARMEVKVLQVLQDSRAVLVKTATLVKTGTQESLAYQVLTVQMELMVSMALQEIQVRQDQPGPMGNREPLVTQAQTANQASVEIQGPMANPEVLELQARMVYPVLQVLQGRKDRKVQMAHPERMDPMVHLVLWGKRRISLASMVLTLPKVPSLLSLWPAKTLVSLGHLSLVVLLVPLGTSLDSLLVQRQALVRAYQRRGPQLALVVLVLTVLLPFHMFT